MRKSWADYKRIQRKRKAEAAKLAGDPTDAVASIKFYEYLTDRDWLEVVTYLEWAGIGSAGIPSFDTDDDPEHNTETDGPYRGSIGRAERMVGCLLDAASQLASEISTYKKEQIDRALVAREQSDLTDPAAKKKALAESARLHKLRAQLDKQVRWTLPQWRVTGS